MTAGEVPRGGDSPRTSPRHERRGEAPAIAPPIARTHPLRDAGKATRWIFLGGAGGAGGGAAAAAKTRAEREHGRAGAVLRVRGSWSRRRWLCMADSLSVCEINIAPRG